jgi:hypothetical protein
MVPLQYVNVFYQWVLEDPIMGNAVPVPSFATAGRLYRGGFPDCLAAAIGVILKNLAFRGTLNPCHLHPPSISQAMM